MDMVISLQNYAQNRGIQLKELIHPVFLQNKLEDEISLTEDEMSDFSSINFLYDIKSSFIVGEEYVDSSITTPYPEILIKSVPKVEKTTKAPPVHLI